MTGWNGKNRAQIAADNAASLDGQIVTVRCAHCPRWSWTGSYGDARRKAADHRTTRHPELNVKHRRHPGLGMHRWVRLHSDDEQRAEAMGEVLRRRATTHADEAA